MRMMARVRARKERHKQRSRVYRAGVVAAGSTLVLLGLILALPGVPGPGLLVVVIGLALLALEFDRAERLLERLAHRVEKLGDDAVHGSRRQKLAAGLLVLVAAAAVIGALVLLDVPLVPF